MIFSVCYRGMECVIVGLSVRHHGIISSRDLKLEAHYRVDVLQTMWRQQAKSLAICSWNAIIIIIIATVCALRNRVGYAQPSDHMNNNKCYLRCTR